MPTIAVLDHRRRAQALPGATARKVAGNAWEIRIPKDHVLHGRLRREPTPEGWDDAVFLLDDQESQPVVGSGEDDRSVWVTALFLD